jgi:hypothetical protein
MIVLPALYLRYGGAAVGAVYDRAYFEDSIKTARS